MPVLSRLGFWFRDLRASRRSSLSERYHVEVVAPDPAYIDVLRFPVELQFVLALHPEWREKLQSLFERGYGIGIRTIRSCPASLLRAVERIADVSQYRITEPWLMRLIHDTEIPVFTEDELREHYDLGMNLFDEAHLILEYRHRMKQFVLIDLEHHGAEEVDRVFVSDMDRALRPVSEMYLLHRIHADLRKDEFHPMRALAIVLLVTGPIAHALEFWVRGMGQLFAALADDVTHATSELFSLRQSGFTPKQLWKQGYVLLPVLVVAVFLVLQVEFIRAASPFFGGFVFGLAAALFPFTNVLRRYADLRSGYAALEQSGKYPAEQRPPLTMLAWRELRRTPLARGSLCGLALMPFLAGFAFLMFPGWVQNGWFLAATASIDVFIAIVVLFIFSRIGDAVYAMKVRELMRV